MTHRKLIGSRHQFTCDHSNCSRTFVKGGTYSSAWDAAKVEGWRCLKVGAKWMHWCSWVHMPNDYELKKMRDDAAK